MSEERLTEAELLAIEVWACGCAEPESTGVLRLLSDLEATRADLAAETATRTALRSQEARVSGLLADAGVPVGDLVAGVAALVASRDENVMRGDVALDERDEARSARDMLLAEVDRLRALVPARCPEKSAGGHAWRDGRCEFCGQEAPR